MGSSEIQLLSLARPRPSHGSVTDYIQLLAPTQCSAAWDVEKTGSHSERQNYENLNFDES